MGAGAPVLAYDCEFNREVTAGRAFFWADADQLTELFDAVAADDLDAELAAFAEAGRARVREAYQWETVTDAYVQIIERLLPDRRRSQTPRRRRTVRT